MTNKSLKKIFVLVLIIVLGISPMVFGAEDADLVYVLPLKEEITQASARYVDLAIKEAEDLGASHLIVDLDTYGGLVDGAEKIKNSLLDTKLDTTCYINSKAESAGVLIAISCDNIYMSPRGTIGSAETIPNTEKVLSMWKSLLRNTAQVQGRDPDVVEAMADAEMEIPDLVEKGKLLNLTAQEAEVIKISDGTVANIDDLIKDLGIATYKKAEANEDWATKLAKAISQQWVSSILIVLAFVGLIVELLMPGFGIPGAISLVSFVLFFGGNLMVGNASWISLIFFVVGVILIAIELFIPGFGLPGIAGIVLSIIGLATSMANLQQALSSIIIAIVIAVLVVYIIFKFGLNSRTFSNITLTTSIKGNSGSDHQEEGREVKLGDRGKTLTMLRPYGFVQINGIKFDASSESTFIDKDQEVEVVKLHGNTIIVKEI
ncbi:MAG: NfeD family protein [Bacillota bacterium]|nr:NfeD family protein [Bacillota bacterium]